MHERKEGNVCPNQTEGKKVSKVAITSSSAILGMLFERQKILLFLLLPYCSILTHLAKNNMYGKCTLWRIA